MTASDWISIAGVAISAASLTIAAFWAVFTMHAKRDETREKELRIAIEAQDIRQRESVHKVRNDLGAQIITLQNIAADERRELNKALLDLQNTLSRHQIQVASQYHTKAEMKDLLEQMFGPVRTSLSDIHSMLVTRRRELDSNA